MRNNFYFFFNYVKHFKYYNRVIIIFNLNFDLYFNISRFGLLCIGFFLKLHSLFVYTMIRICEHFAIVYQKEFHFFFY